MATIPGFKELKGRSDDLDRVQANITQYTVPISKNPTINGRLLKDIALTTSETLVEHKLGRDYQGWQIVDKNAAQDVYVSSTPSKSRFLALTAGGTVTVSIWVF